MKTGYMPFTSILAPAPWKAVPVIVEKLSGSTESVKNSLLFLSNGSILLEVN